MPLYAHVVARVPCPACGAEIPGLTDDLVAFQWGYCPGRQPWDALFYRVGDTIRWRLDDRGEIRAWVFFEGRVQGGNVGDPAVSDLLVRAWDLGGSDLVCAKCGARGVAIRIQGGRIVGFEAAPAGCDLVVIDPDGGLQPRPDWDDHPMPETLLVKSRDLATGDGRVIKGPRAP